MHKKKITFKLLIREILDIVEFKRGTPRTFLKMITKPSLVVDSFLMLSHRKNGFVGPFRILFIIATMCVFINESLKSDEFLGIIFSFLKSSHSVISVSRPHFISFFDDFLDGLIGETIQDWIVQV